MEKLQLGDQEVMVREAGRPVSTRLCRHLISADNEQHFLEYVISVGPFKFDIPIVYPLTEAQVAACAAGTLQLGQLAEQLADSDEHSGKYERPS
jgi:hypothetical protein